MASELTTWPHEPAPGFGILRIVSNGAHDSHVFVRVNDGGVLREYELDDVVGCAWHQLDPSEPAECTVRAIGTAVEANVSVRATESAAATEPPTP